VAEGVETETQRDLLGSLACDRAQGFWFQPPGRAASIEDRVLGPVGAAEGQAR